MTAPLSIDPVIQHQRIGQILMDSHLISEAKLMVALYEQSIIHLRLGEILVAHGWTTTQTVDFFAEQWITVNQQAIRYPLGQYFLAAGLIDAPSIQQILHDQQCNGNRFGDNAVLLGLIKQGTLDYFIENLYPEQKGHTRNS